MKTAIRIGFYNVLVFLSLLILLEFSVRLFVQEIQIPGTQSQFIKENAYRTSRGLNPGVSGISNGVEKLVDERGFWAYREKKPDSTKKILFLGDSVTMGIGVDSDATFSGIIHNSIKEISIFNPSVIGYSSSDYLNVIESLIVENHNTHSIQSVIIFWCLNDVYDNTIADIGLSNSTLSGKIVAGIRNNSKLYQFLKKSFLDRPRSYFLHDLIFYTPDNISFNKAMFHLVGIDEILGENGVDFRVILLPYEYQIRRPMEEYLAPNTLMLKSLDSNGVAVTDFTPAFISSATNSSSYFLYGDGIHYNELGHKLIAELLLDSLVYHSQD